METNLSSSSMGWLTSILTWTVELNSRSNDFRKEALSILSPFLSCAQFLFQLDFLSTQPTTPWHQKGSTKLPHSTPYSAKLTTRSIHKQLLSERDRKTSLTTSQALTISKCNGTTNSHSNKSTEPAKSYETSRTPSCITSLKTAKTKRSLSWRTS